MLIKAFAQQLAKADKSFHAIQVQVASLPKAARHPRQHAGKQDLLEDLGKN
ncbi:MAG: hypothetical protein GXP24_06630 [Planctomycetes bacterium]|nr:hypothetical protein [Planctomycetota bacterium]